MTNQKPEYKTISKWVKNERTHKTEAKSNFGPPLRSTRELAEEFGVSLKSLCTSLRAQGAPQPVTRTGTTSAGRNSYYNPAEFRKWWAELKKSS